MAQVSETCAVCGGPASVIVSRTPFGGAKRRTRCCDAPPVSVSAEALSAAYASGQPHPLNVEDARLYAIAQEA